MELGSQMVQDGVDQKTVRGGPSADHHNITRDERSWTRRVSNFRHSRRFSDKKSRWNSPPGCVARVDGTKSLGSPKGGLLAVRFLSVNCYGRSPTQLVMNNLNSRFLLWLVGLNWC